MKQNLYIIENLDCANCGAKIEEKLNAHPEVQEAVITFSTRQLRLTAEDPDALMETLQAIARTVESEVTFLPREKRHSHDHNQEHHCQCGHDHDHPCGCGHDHEHEHPCSCGHDHDHAPSCGCGCGHDHGDHHGEVESPKPLIFGAVLFALGLVLEGLELGWAALAVCAVAYVLLGRDVVAQAVKNLRNGHMLDENFLMALASLGAFFIGDAPEGVGVMLFYRVGEYFEHRAVARSRSQIMETVDLRPEVVNKLVGEEVRTIPAEDARVGDLLLVRPGDRIPLDGVVVQGESRIDTAPITGEPVPVHAAVGDEVISGCVNTVGQLVIRVEKPLSESMVTRILDSVENAAASKPKIDRFITRFARVYTPVVVAIAAATAILPSIFTGNWNYWVYTALSFLVMSCPCALVLSVPLAFFAGIGAGGKKGILFKGGVSMEAMGKIKAVVMDKTGTLTRGDFTVQEVSGGDGLLALCAGCEQQSTHPIAVSIVAAAKERGLELQRPETLEEIPGQGIRALWNGKTVLCGNGKLLQAFDVDFPETVGYGTQVLVAVDGVCAGYIRIADSLKPGAAAAVQELNGRYVTVMLTGDDAKAAQAVADQTGIRQVHGNLLPQQKLEQLQAIRQTVGAAMFVGDGINDAPVLAGADVGAAMGSGADAAIEAADVVFMTSDPGAIPESLEIARKTGSIAWQNVIFALTIKFAVMILGLLGFASMWLAVFADSGVAMLCVLNSVRLLYKK